MKSIPVIELNSMIYDPHTLVEKSENAYADQISRAAERIYRERRKKPVVLISGPSGSGKTTTAGRLARLLEDNGCRAHIISMDNYFLPLSADERRLAEEGKFDFESPKRLDTELFRRHIELLSRCRPIDVPAFDFTLQDRKTGFRLEYQPGDIVIMEGIHALNPDVIGHSDDYTNRVYVSVRTRLESGGELLHPSKIRLMRRLIRDKLYRGRSITETMEFFKSVERGENLYIMPYKHRASFDIDTFIAYEPMVYRNILLGDLHGVSKTFPEYEKYADIEKFLRELEPLDPANVPDNSLVREFIG
ncbi:MAG: nucleoside kinase [Oscillospiraceae bacterium]|nr:nucleoside kinase [Oscillospiraceae bacterium]